MFDKFLSLDEKRRNKLLNVALKEFSARGYDDASTNVIARESGLSKGLMFHYIKNKKDFFLYLCDYCLDLIREEYFNQINLGEKDILDRLRQTFLVKIELLNKYPWIFEFIKVIAQVKSDEIDKEMKERFHMVLNESYDSMFGGIDESRFKAGLNVERCKQLILWGIIGFSNHTMEAVVDSENETLNYEAILHELDGYLDEFRKAFYEESE